MSSWAHRWVTRLAAADVLPVLPRRGALGCRHRSERVRRHGGRRHMALAMGAENNVFERNGEVSIGVTYMTGSLVGSGSASWRRWSAPIASTDSLPGSLDEFRSRGCRRGCVLPASSRLLK